MKKILILDNYDSFTYNLVHLVEELALAKVEVFRNDKISVEVCGVYDTIILSPGPGLPAQAGIMPELIQKYKNSKPILGVCLGHQALGEAFGATLKNLKRIYHGIQSEIKLIQKEKGIFKGFPDTIQVGRYHSWVVQQEGIPNEFEVTAIAEKGIVMAMQHKDLPLTGVQFHPESVMTPDGKKMMENWIHSFLNL
ncbi:MAG: aminodeoxychorismate/anthranilate synthase component II [Saprospiraceae bacterium]